jgi:methoxymalonate biosynthesis acyl carrier protein
METNVKIREFIESNLVVFNEEAKFTDSDNIFEMGFVNSLFAMKLLTYIEKEFNISVENDEMEIANFSSVNNIVGLISKKCQ